MNNLKTLWIFIPLFFICITDTTYAFVFKIATLSPEGSFAVQQMRSGADEITKQTNKRVKFKFYPGGVMGNDRSVLRKIRFNQLQGGALSSGSLANVCFNTQVYCLPFLFNSLDEVDYVRKIMDQKIIDQYAKDGFTVFGIAEGGFAYIMSNNPIKTIQDLKKQKIWIPEKDIIALEAVKAFDLTPIPLSIADVRIGLQTGLIDTIAVPPVYALILQWHTQIKYLTQLPMLYTYGVLAISTKIFNKISYEDQKIVRNIMTAVFKKIGEHNRIQSADAMKTLIRLGIEMIKPDKNTLNQWTSKKNKVEKILIDKQILSKEMIDSAKNLLLKKASLKKI